MPTVNIIAEAVRGELAGQVNIPNRPAGPIQFELVSNEFLSRPDVTFTYSIERSLDNEVTWELVTNGNAIGGPFSGSSKQPPGSLPKFGFYNDGQKSTMRYTLTPNMPFSWGINVTY